MLSVVAISALPSSAGAAVTIGSDLAPDPDSSASCAVGDTCTIANSVVSGASTSSPLDGVVVRWRVRSAGADFFGDPARVKVIRPAVGGEFTGVSTSGTQTIPDTNGTATTFTFPTQQPIATGDLVAIDLDSEANELLIRDLTQPTATRLRWQPSLLDGQSRAPDTSTSMVGEHMFNADIEPDCDLDGFGDETQDPDTSACNSPPETTADGTAPETTLTRVPKNKVKTFSRRADVLFEFTSSEPGSTFACSLDGKAFAACDSPHVFKVKAKRKKAKKHEFAVRATDTAGNGDPTPATDEFKVKRKSR